MVDFGIVIVAGYFFIQQVEIYKGALSFHQGIVIHLGSVTGKHFGSFIECEVVIFSVNYSHCADGEQRVFVIIPIVQAGLQYGGGDEQQQKCG